MKIDFRQGIVSYPESTGGQAFLQVTGGGTDVNILTGSGETTVAFAQRTADYLYVETNPITGAWSGLPVTEAWIYWDINPQTGVVSYGFTEVQPTSGPTQPGILVADQHWFDTTVNVMKVYDGTRFLEKIRVFAARIVGTSLTPFGSNTAKPYAGSQVGITQTTFAGQILFAQGLPVIVSIPSTFSPTATNPFARNFIFATTETEFIAGSSQKVTNIRLESDVSTAQASIAIAAFDVVQYSDFGVITPANYNDTESTTIGMVTDDVSIGEIVSVVHQGVITNEAWNWTTVGQELFILTNGDLTANDPNITTPSLYPVSKPPVARVVSNKELLFMQGLGKVGPRGLNPESIDSIGDVTITNPQEGAVLTFSGSPMLWRNASGFVVDYGSPVTQSAGDLLYYNGTSWTNLGQGTAGQVLTMGSPLTPIWQDTEGGGSGLAASHIFADMPVQYDADYFTLKEDFVGYPEDIATLEATIGSSITAFTFNDTAGGGFAGRDDTAWPWGHAQVFTDGVSIGDIATLFTYRTLEFNANRSLWFSTRVIPWVTDTNVRYAFGIGTSTNIKSEQQLAATTSLQFEIGLVTGSPIYVGSPLILNVGSPAAATQVDFVVRNSAAEIFRSPVINLPTITGGSPDTPWHTYQFTYDGAGTITYGYDGLAVGTTTQIPNNVINLAIGLHAEVVGSPTFCGYYCDFVEFVQETGRASGLILGSPI